MKTTDLTKLGLSKAQIREIQRLHSEDMRMVVAKASAQSDVQAVRLAITAMIGDIHDIGALRDIL